MWLEWQLVSTLHHERPMTRKKRLVLAEIRGLLHAYIVQMACYCSYLRYCENNK